MNVKEFCLPVRSEEDVLAEQDQLSRAAVYELLGALLAKPPAEEQLGKLRGIDALDAGSEEQPGSAGSATTAPAAPVATASEIAMGWSLLQQASVKASPVEIEDEYFSLFIGLGRGELVPFGSWYMTGFLMEKPVAVLRRDLESLGIEREEGVSETEDHIAALCDAMAIIIRNSSEIGFEREKKFFSDHLEPWAKTFFSDLQHADSAHFYRSVGFFGESIIKFETEYFAMQA